MSQFWDFVQGSSGVVLTAFIAAHSVNNVLSTLGEGTYNAVQAALRHVYQHPVGEAVLFGSAIAHVVASGVKLTRAWSTRKRPATWRQAVHRYGGYAFVLLFVAHTYACRWGRDADLDFGALAFSARHPAMKFVFQPYIIVLFSVGMLHTLLGFPKALAMTTGGRIPSVSLRTAAVVTGVAAALILAGFSGLFDGRSFTEFSGHPYAKVLAAKGMI